MSFFRVFLFIFLFSVQSFAQNSLYFGIRHGFESTRALGMGNAFVGVANDNTAIFYNPAGLRTLKEGESNWFLKGDAGKGIKGFIDDIDEAGKQTDEVAAISDVLQKNYGKQFSFRAPSLGWLWARPKWGIAVIPLDLSVDMGLHRTVGPSINLTAIQDTTIAFTRAWDLHKSAKVGSFHLGVTGKLIYRINVDEVVSVASVALNDEIFNKNDAKEGMTFDADVGFLWKGPWKRFNPSAGVVIRNIGDYGYFSNLKIVGDKTGKPEKLHRVIDVGGAWEGPQWWIFSTRMALDMRDMLHPNWTLKKGFHFGSEFSWDISSWWRGAWRIGVNQGYFTAGFSGELGIFKLDLASYGEEVGVEGSNLENRRYMFSMSLDF